MKRSHLVALGLGVALLAGGGAGYWFWNSARSAELARACIPARPELTTWPAELRKQIGAHEDAIRRGDAPGAALAALSRLYHANGFYAEAGLCYQGLMQLQPREPRWPHRLAALLAGFGRLEEAIPLWERAVTLDSDYFVARIRLADALLKTNRADDAARQYEAALKKSPDNPYALVGLARIAMAAGRWSVARDRLETAASVSNEAIGPDLLATVYEQLGDQGRATMLRGRQKAAGTFSDIPDPWIDELFDDCFDTYRIAVASGTFAHAGDVATAQRLIERALSLSPDSVPTLFQRAGYRMRQNDLAGARKDFQRCTELDPGFSDGWAYLSAVLRQQNLSSEADRVLAEGLRHNPNSPGMRLDYGRRLAALGDETRAAAEFRESIRLRPEEADAYLELSKLLFRAERIAEGIALLEQAQKVEPDNPSVLSTLAYSAISAGDEPAARHWLQRIRQQPRVSSETRSTLGTAFRERFGHFAD